ncbi:hypothetical protein [Streptomyces sp. NPDC056987]|uniref:hypothetical protein n=1 Tax=Streptomyces sp. NPDC056987 TaxID=3345988 RepID=UPI003630BE91
MVTDDPGGPDSSRSGARREPAQGVPLAPLPEHRNVNTAWWQEQWRRHAHITTPLRQRGLGCDIEFALSSFIVRVPLADSSYLIIGPPQETTLNAPFGDPEGWTVTRHHADHELFEVIYDSAPSAGSGAPERPEVRHGMSATPLVEAIDQHLARLGLLPGPVSSARTPLVAAAPERHGPDASDPSGDADDASVYPCGDALRALTDRLNATESHADAAKLLHQIVDPDNGLLEQLADFFEAAAEKAKDAEQDDAFDLSYDLDDAAAQVRDLGEILRVTEEGMRALTSPPPVPLPSRALPRTPRLPPPNPPPAAPKSARPPRR